MVVEKANVLVTGLPTVSVVIPAYNRAHQLRATVLSVLNQTYSPSEVIIIDDASTDNTSSTLDGLREMAGETTIRYQRHETNLGGGAARNTGVQLAQGDLVAFLDSDDEWRPEKLARQVDEWMLSQVPENTVVYCSLETFQGWRHEIRRGVPSEEKLPLGDSLFLRNRSIQTSCVLLPRALALTVPIDESLRAHQDFYLVLALNRRGAEFLYIDEPLVRYSTAPSSERISSSRTPDASILFLQKYAHWLTPRAALGFKARYLAVRLGQSGKKWQAASILSTALLKGVISGRSYFWYLTRSLVPTALEKGIRNWLAKGDSKQRPVQTR